MSGHAHESREEAKSAWKEVRPAVMESPLVSEAALGRTRVHNSALFLLDSNRSRNMKMEFSCRFRAWETTVDQPWESLVIIGGEVA